MNRSWNWKNGAEIHFRQNCQAIADGLREMAHDTNGAQYRARFVLRHYTTIKTVTEKVNKALDNGFTIAARVNRWIRIVKYQSGRIMAEFKTPPNRGKTTPQS